MKQCGSNAIAEHRAHAHVRDAPLTHRHGARYLVWQEGASPLAELPNCQWRRSRWAANEQKQRKHGGCAAESLWNGTSTEGPGRHPVTNEQKQTWPINGNHECEDPDSPAYLSRPRVESAHLVLPNAPRCLAARHHVQTPRLSAGDRAPLGSYSNLFANKKLGFACHAFITSATILCSMSRHLSSSWRRLDDHYSSRDSTVLAMAGRWVI